jgi:hypothetical protein
MGPMAQVAVGDALAEYLQAHDAFPPQEIK